MDRDQLLKVFKALANESRLKMLETIRNNQAQCSCCPENIGIFEFSEGGICCVEEIVDQFDMAQSTISQHLKELHNAGLLERHKKAQWVYYTVNRKRLDELAAYFQELVSELAQKR
jgi:DNA-binding transcriptional ArsR family regulator